MTGPVRSLGDVVKTRNKVAFGTKLRRHTASKPAKQHREPSSEMRFMLTRTRLRIPQCLSVVSVPSLAAMFSTPGSRLKSQPGTVARVCTPSARESEARGYPKFKASLSHILTLSQTKKGSDNFSVAFPEYKARCL